MQDAEVQAPHAPGRAWKGPTAPPPESSKGILQAARGAGCPQGWCPHQLGGSHTRGWWGSISSLRVLVICSRHAESLEEEEEVKGWEWPVSDPSCPFSVQVQECFFNGPLSQSPCHSGLGVKRAEVSCRVFGVIGPPTMCLYHQHLSPVSAWERHAVASTRAPPTPGAGVL